MPLPPGSSDSGQALLSSKCAAWRSPMLSSSATPSGTSSRLDLNDSLQYVRCCQPRLLHPVVSPGSEMLPFLVVPHFFELMPHRRPAQLSRHLRSIIICAEDIDVRHWISAFLSLKQFWTPRSRPCTNWSGRCMYGFGEIEPKVWVTSLKMLLSFVPVATQDQK